jgi:hypothetical protein
MAGGCQSQSSHVFSLSTFFGLASFLSVASCVHCITFHDAIGRPAPFVRSARYAGGILHALGELIRGDAPKRPLAK